MVPCYVCRKEVEHIYSECGRFFCDDHGAPARSQHVHRWWLGRYPPWLSLETRGCCNLCRPNAIGV
jgi:hypothetical protein